MPLQSLGLQHVSDVSAERLDIWSHAVLQSLDTDNNWQALPSRSMSVSGLNISTICALQIDVIKAKQGENRLVITLNGKVWLVPDVTDVLFAIF